MFTSRSERRRKSLGKRRSREQNYRVHAKRRRHGVVSRRVVATLNHLTDEATTHKSTTTTSLATNTVGPIAGVEVWPIGWQQGKQQFAYGCTSWEGSAYPMYSIQGAIQVVWIASPAALHAPATINEWSKWDCVDNEVTDYSAAWRECVRRLVVKCCCHLANER